MVRRGGVPSVHPFLRRLERRRLWRSRRVDGEARLYRLARRRCVVAVAGASVAEPRLGLRRQRIRGRAPGLRHARRFRRAARGLPCARHPRAARRGALPYLRRACVVRRQPSARDAVGLVCVGGACARRYGAEQLAQRVRRAGVVVPAGAAPALSPQIPAPAAQAQLAQRRGKAGGARRARPVARARRRWLPSRRGERLSPRSRARGQSAGADGESQQRDLGPCREFAAPPARLQPDRQHRGAARDPRRGRETRRCVRLRRVLGRLRALRRLRRRRAACELYVRVAPCTEIGAGLRAEGDCDLDAPSRTIGRASHSATTTSCAR